MLPSDVARSYDQIAERWAHLGRSKNGLAAHERAISFVSNGKYALDVGSGCSGRIADLLLAHRFAVDAIDISPRMVELGRGRSPDVEFHCADVRNWPVPRRYDLISAWDSIWHVPLDDQELVLRKLMDALVPSGVLIFTTPGLDEPTEKTDRTMGPALYYSGMGIPNTLGVITASGGKCLHLEYDQWPELHTFLIAQKTTAS